MSLRAFTPVPSCTSPLSSNRKFQRVLGFAKGSVVAAAWISGVAFAQWRVDFSRRLPPKKTAPAVDTALPASPSVEVVDVSARAEQAPRKLPEKMIEKELEQEPLVAESTTRRAVPVGRDLSTATSDSQDLVVLLTEKGFVPSSVRMKVGGQYRLHVVNINEREKNVSFVLDAFAEHHGLFFGREKVVSLIPQRDGIFQFECPETAMAGRLVILPTDSGRRPTADKSSDW